MRIIRITLLREEALACIIALLKEKPYGWRDDALKKLDKKMDFKKQETKPYRGIKGERI